MSGLQIEEGKWYRRRDGVVVGPAWHRESGRLFPWCLGEHETMRTIYMDDGRFEPGGCRAELDLVREVSAPLPQNPVDIAIAAEIDAETAATTFGPIEQHTPPDSAWQPADKADGYEIKEVGDHSLDALVAARVFGAIDDNPKTIVGRVKPALRAIPPIAILHLGGAMGDGESKYGRFNWRDNTVTSSVYYDAIQRHLLAWWDGENNASDSGRSHLAHIMACCAILLDAEAASKLNDDRRKESLASAYVAGEVAQISEP